MRSTLLTNLAFLLLGSVWLPAQTTSTIRSFQNPQGVVITGEIVEWQEDRIKVRRENQSVVEIPFHLLIPEQAEQLSKEASSRRGYAAAPSAKDVDALLQQLSSSSPSEVYQSIRQRLIHSYPSKYEYNEPWMWIAYWMELFAKARTVPPTPLLRILLNNPDLSRQFFALTSAQDDPSAMLNILTSLYEKYPDDFTTFLGLALAISIVHDGKPPSSWPHSQVSATALPRKLQPYDQVFHFLVKSQKERRLENDLTRLPLRDLLFLTDIIAPIEELEWAQKEVRERTSSFERVYSNVRYANERVDFKRGHFRHDWPYNSYTLEGILQTGGICVDQAYFSWQVGKAKGIPTILFVGHGDQGSHAWIGYLNGNRGWNLDVGRYSQGKFVTGTAFSPQDWQTIKDHELVFLRERFQDGNQFRESSYHLNVAKWMLADKMFTQAKQALNNSLKLEPRNANSWALMRQMTTLQGNKTEEKAVLENAMGTMQRFPDWHNYFRMELSKWLLEQNKPEEAFQEWQLLIRRQLANRPDLAVANMADFLLSMQNKVSADDFQRYSKRTLSQASQKVPDMIAVQDLLIPVCDGFLKANQKEQALAFITEFKDSFKLKTDSQAYYVVTRLGNAIHGRPVWQ
jgi:Tfp pilus assembly protein PilF